MASLNERLVKAAEEGNVDEIATLLDQGADIDCAPPPSSSTPLIKAIRCMNEAAALYLINRGANVRLTDVAFPWNTALHWACREGVEAVVRELLKRGADVEAKGWRRRRPLHAAVEFGHESIARLLVTEHGAEINARERDGFTPLLTALEYGHDGVAAFLLSAGADASISSIDGWTALYCACRSGLTGLAVRLLDEFGLDLHAKRESGKSCLHFAAFNGQVETCRLLLERGLPVDEIDDEGRSPLFKTFFRGHGPAAELLLDYGADIEHQDEDGYTPLCGATAEYSTTFAIFLVERGARFDAPLPEDFPFASIDKGLAQRLQFGLLKTLFAEPGTPIPPYRRTLHWALTSPAVAALMQKHGWSLLGAAKTDDEVEEMIKKRLGLVEDDAWKRRMHLVIDRALDWGYGDSSKAPEAKKPRLDENKEGEEEEKKASAGQARREE